MKKSTPLFIIIHHTAISYKKTPVQFDIVDRYHRSLGWGKIGYNYLIEMDGTIRIGRKENEIGAHCRSDKMNYRSMGIALAGNYNSEVPTSAQLRALETLVLLLENRYNIDRATRVLGHQEVKGAKTSCPGFLVHWIQSHRLTVPNQKEKEVKELAQKIITILS